MRIVIRNKHFKLEGDGVREFPIFPGADDILVVNIRRVINVDSDGVLSIFIPSRVVYQNCLPSSVGMEVLIVPDNSVGVLGDSSNFALDLHCFPFYHRDLVSSSMVEVDRFAHVVSLPEKSILFRGSKVDEN